MSEPRQVEAQGPSLSAKGSYVSFKLAVWELLDHKSQTDYRNIILEKWQTGETSVSELPT